MKNYLISSIRMSVESDNKKSTHMISERPEWNFTETGPKPKYGFFTEPEPKLNTEKML